MRDICSIILKLFHSFEGGCRNCLLTHSMKIFGLENKRKNGQVQSSCWHFLNVLVLTYFIGWPFMRHKYCTSHFYGNAPSFYYIFRICITLMRVRIPFFTLMQIRIRHIALMRIRVQILVLIKVKRICDHWFIDPPMTSGLYSGPPHSTNPESVSCFWRDADPDPASQMMWISMDPDPQHWFQPSILGSLHISEEKQKILARLNTCTVLYSCAAFAKLQPASRPTSGQTTSPSGQSAGNGKSTRMPRHRRPSTWSARSSVIPAA